MLHSAAKEGSRAFRHFGRWRMRIVPSATPLVDHLRNARGNLAASGLLVLAWACVGIWTVNTVGAEWWGTHQPAGAEALAASLDLGLSFYVTRQVTARSPRRSCETLLSACEAVSFAGTVVLLLGAVVAWMLGAGSYFSGGGTLSPDVLSRGISLLVVVSVALSYPATLYRAVLAGLGSQRTYSRTLGFFGAAKILIVVPTIIATDRLDSAILSTCLVSVAETMTCRWLAKRAIGGLLDAAGNAEADPFLDSPLTCEEFLCLTDRSKRCTGANRGRNVARAQPRSRLQLGVDALRAGTPGATPDNPGDLSSGLLVREGSVRA